MHYINLFMFSYQHSFRASLEGLSKQVLKTIGADVSPKVLLVGARAPGSPAPHPVCVEPEDGEWTLDPFANLLNTIEEIVPNHPMQDIFYGDEPRMRDKPENIRRSSVRMAVDAALAAPDQEASRKSFLGIPVRVGDYYVVPVIQVPEALFAQFPPLELPQSDDPRVPRGIPSFIHACMAELLEDASRELLLPEPGRALSCTNRSPEDIARAAASNFMHTPAYLVTQQYVPGNLLERFNEISSLMYEGLHGIGHLLLSDSQDTAIEYLVRFKKPVPFGKPRWARKILQMASVDIALIADSECIYGLGKMDRLESRASQMFIVDFLDHYHWQFRKGQQVLLRSLYGRPALPREEIGQDRFIDNYSRIFPESSQQAHDQMWQLFSTAISLKHGSMIVVAADARPEAERLAQQGTPIEPTPLTPELLTRASGIDGTILVDPECVCHAIGVILDGMATSECTPSRGSRFNSGIRYIHRSDTRRLAIVVSEDRTIDVFPLLRPRVDRDQVERMVATLEAATADNYHQTRNWCDAHRFYMDADQCSRINEALQRIEEANKGTMRIFLKVPPFKPDTGMNDSFFLPRS